MAQGQVVKERSRNQSFILLRLMPSCVSQICTKKRKCSCVSLELWEMQEKHEEMDNRKEGGAKNVQGCAGNHEDDGVA